jgi:hypothetical protein
LAGPLDNFYLFNLSSEEWTDRHGVLKGDPSPARYSLTHALLPSNFSRIIFGIALLPRFITSGSFGRYKFGFTALLGKFYAFAGKGAGELSFLF